MSIERVAGGFAESRVVVGDKCWSERIGCVNAGNVVESDLFDESILLGQVGAFDTSFGRC
jgi:hypothetical protein